MSEAPETQQEATSRACVAVLCEACGGLFRARRWREGMACPRCRSGHVKPVVAPGGAVDYYVADRSQGHVPADIRFAQWAKWCELITPRQYEIAFVKQNRLIQDGRPARPIHEVMVGEGFLNELEAAGVLEFMSRPRPDAEDASFVEALLTMVDVEKAKLEEVQGLQRKASEQCHEVPPLCQLLLEQRVVSEGQMLAALKFQERMDKGSLRAVKQLVTKPKKESAVGAVRRAVSLKDPTVRKVALVVVLFLIAIVMWVRQGGGQSAELYVYCKKCSQVSPVGWTTEFPVECPACGANEAFYAVVCPKGHVFIRGSPYSHELCPVCGATSARPYKVKVESEKKTSGKKTK